jgi:excisionase family DNA binding protein
MSTRNDRPVLLTVREVSRVLRVQRPKVYELIKDGAIDGFKVGADWRVRRDSVEGLIRQIPGDFFKSPRWRPEAIAEEEDKPLLARPMPS